MTKNPTGTKYRMGELTGGEARAMAARNPVILLPLGSHEDQGPHAPMGDYLSAERVAEKIVHCEQLPAERYHEIGLRLSLQDRFGQEAEHRLTMQELVRPAAQSDPFRGRKRELNHLVAEEGTPQFEGCGSGQTFLEVAGVSREGVRQNGN